MPDTENVDTDITHPESVSISLDDPEPIVSQDETIEDDSDISFVDTSKKSEEISEEKSESEDEIEDTINEEEEFFRSKGLTGLKTYKEAAEKLAENVQGDQTKAGLIARADRIFKEKNLGSLEDALKLIESHSEITDGSKGVKSTFVSEYMGSIESHLEQEDVNTKRRLERGEITEDEANYQLGRFQNDKKFYSGLLDAFGKDILAYIENKYGNRLGEIETRGRETRIHDLWNKFPDQTRKRWAEQKDGLINHILSDPKLYNTDKPFIVGMNSYIAAQQLLNPDFKIPGNEDVSDIVQKELDAQRDKDRKKASRKAASSPKLSEKQTGLRSDDELVEEMAKVI